MCSQFTHCYGVLQHVAGFHALFTVVGPQFLNPICSKMTCTFAWRSLTCDACPEARSMARATESQREPRIQELWDSWLMLTSSFLDVAGEVLTALEHAPF